MDVVNTVLQVERPRLTPLHLGKQRTLCKQPFPLGIKYAAPSSIVIPSDVVQIHFCNGAVAILLVVVASVGCGKQLIGRETV